MKLSLHQVQAETTLGQLSLRVSHGDVTWRALQFFRVTGGEIRGALLIFDVLVVFRELDLIQVVVVQMPQVNFVRNLVKEALVVGQISIIVNITLVPTTMPSSCLVFYHGGKEHHTHLLYTVRKHDLQF
jgi:hypothetical protein